ncbi:MAG TPA: hypothetical protein VIY96_08405 [Thermoanaerobaculia bacterium]
MSGMLLSLLLSVAVGAPSPSPAPARPVPKEPAFLGLAMNLPESAPTAARKKALETVRGAGVSVFAFELSWRDADAKGVKYDLASITRAARLLRQSGAVLHLDLPLVNGRLKLVPWDLSALPFDDPKLARRLGTLLDALGPALLDFSTLSLGNDADTYFADKPDELRAYRRLFDGTVEFLRRRAPRLMVGVATAAPTETRAPLVVTALQRKSPALFYIYAPFLRDKPFTHRPPESIEADWNAILRSAGGRPVAFTEVSFSSAAENGSSPAKQADFVRRMRRLLQETDRSRLLFARYVPWRDPEPAPPVSDGLHPLPPGEGTGGEGVSIRRSAFFANRGLQKFDGTPKPAWEALRTVPGAPAP